MGKLYHLYYRGLTTKFLIITMFLCGFIFLISLYIFLNLSTHQSVNQRLGVHFLNIGQGDAIYIKAPNNNSVLIDSGPQNEKVIAEIQQFKNIFDRRINVLLITHADADHIGSMKKVIEKFQYQKFAYSGLSSDTKLFQDLMIQVGQVEHINENKKLVLTSGMSIVLDEAKDIRFDVLFPDFDFQINGYKNCKVIQENKSQKNKKVKSKSKSSNTKDPCLKLLNTETNLNSIVGRLSYGSTSFMLTGDAPVEVEKFIIERHENKSFDRSTRMDQTNLKSDVLKLGHHGSKTSTSAVFLNALSPNFAVISVGKDNRYGHPHKIVLDTLDDYKKSYQSTLEVFRTDLDGTVSFYSDGTHVYPHILH